MKNKGIKLMCMLFLVLLVNVATVLADTDNTNNTTDTPTFDEVTKPADNSAQATAEPKFRIGPKVTLRPVEDTLYVYDDGTSSDGLVELFMNNPTLNDVSLTVDAYVDVPSNIHIISDDFVLAGGAGSSYATFSIPPGSSRIIKVRIKAAKEGRYTLDFTGLYYPGDNKDRYQPISLTYPIVVIQKPGQTPELPKGNGTSGGEDPPGNTSIILYGIIAIVALVVIGGIFKGDKGGKIDIDISETGEQK